MQPLRGIKVVDLSKVIAGPLCAQWLGDLGADVVKVEPVEQGDETRGWPPFTSGQSATFMSLNRNKRSVALDLKREEGRRVVEKLVARADIVIQGFGSGTAERLGVDHASLSRIKPDLIYCEISGFGRTGPMGQRPGYDVMVQAFSGLIDTMGEPGGGIVRASFSPVDQATGSHALSGILAALLQRQATGEGVRVEISLLDSAMSLLGYMSANYWQGGKLPKKMGSAHPLLCPYQAFDTADGSIMLAVGNDAQWRRFCAAAGLGDLARDARFATNAARVERFDETTSTVQARLRAEPTARWEAALEAAGVPFSPINRLAEALAHPQVAEGGLVVEDLHPAAGPIRNIAYPVRHAGQVHQSQRHPPMHGEHTAEILSELGFADEIVRDMAKSGVVGLNRAAPASQDTGFNG